MEDNNKHVDFQRAKKANSGFLFRALGVVVVLYWLYEIIRDYLRGGPDAPTLAVLIVACIVMGGGAIFVAVVSLKAWKAEKAAAEMSEEEVEEMMALREAEEE